MAVDENRRIDLEQWLEPFLARLSHPAPRRMCPLYIAGLIGPGDRKSYSLASRSRSSWNSAVLPFGYGTEVAEMRGPKAKKRLVNATAAIRTPVRRQGCRHARYDHHQRGGSSRSKSPSAKTPMIGHRWCPPLLGSGAVEKTRTSTSFRTQRPQRCASTNSATTARDNRRLMPAALAGRRR